MLVKFKIVVKNHKYVCKLLILVKIVFIFNEKLNFSVKNNEQIYYIHFKFEVKFEMLFFKTHFYIIVL